MFGFGLRFLREPFFMWSHFSSDTSAVSSVKNSRNCCQRFRSFESNQDLQDFGFIFRDI
jgi:hypothetical protein